MNMETYFSNVFPYVSEKEREAETKKKINTSECQGETSRGKYQKMK